MKKTFKFKIQNSNIITLLGCLFAFACAATDIVPNPSAPGNLGSATNGFPNAYASNFFGRFIGDGSGLTNLNAGGGTNGGAPLAAGPGITITTNGVTNVVSVTSGAFATPAQVAQATNGLGSAAFYATNAFDLAGAAQTAFQSGSNYSYLVSLAEFNAAVSQITNNQPVISAGAFIGNGSGLTNLNAGGGTNGGAPLAAGPGITITTNGVTNVVSVTSGAFDTNGAAQAALVTGINYTIGSVNSAITQITNNQPVISAGAFTGNGSGLTNLSAGQLTGNVPVSALGNIAGGSNITVSTNGGQIIISCPSGGANGGTNGGTFISDAIQLHTNNWFSYQGTNYFFPGSTTACLKEIDTLWPRASNAVPNGISIRLDPAADYRITTLGTTLTNNFMIQGAGNWSSGFTYWGSTNGSSATTVGSAVSAFAAVSGGPPMLAPGVAMLNFVNATYSTESNVGDQASQVHFKDLYFRSATNFPVVLCAVAAINLYCDRVAWLGPDAISFNSEGAAEFPMELNLESFGYPAVIGMCAGVQTIETFNDCCVFELADGIIVSANPWLRVEDFNAESVGQAASGSAASVYAGMCGAGFSLYIGPWVYSAVVHAYNGYQDWSDIWVANTSTYGGTTISDVVGGQALVNGILIQNGAMLPTLIDCSVPVSAVSSTGTIGGTPAYFTERFPSDGVEGGRGSYSLGFSGNYYLFNFFAGTAIGKSDPWDFGGDGSVQSSSGFKVTSGAALTASTITATTITATTLTGDGSGLTGLPFSTNALLIPLSYAGTDSSNLLVNCAGLGNCGKVSFALTLTNNTWLTVSNATPGISFYLLTAQNAVGCWQRNFPAQVPNGYATMGTNANGLGLDVVLVLPSGHLLINTVCTNQIP